MWYNFRNKAQFFYKFWKMCPDYTEHSHCCRNCQTLRSEIDNINPKIVQYTTLSHLTYKSSWGRDCHYPYWQGQNWNTHSFKYKCLFEIWDIRYWDLLFGRHYTGHLRYVCEQNIQDLYSHSTIILEVQTDHKKFKKQKSVNCVKHWRLKISQLWENSAEEHSIWESKGKDLEKGEKQQSWQASEQGECGGGELRQVVFWARSCTTLYMMTKNSYFIPRITGWHWKFWSRMVM